MSEFPVNFNQADTAFVLLASSAVFLMSPACGYFYSGTVEFKNAVSLILFAYVIYATITIQWYLFGFRQKLFIFLISFNSLAFSDSSQNNFIGDFSYGALNNVLDMKRGHPGGPSIPVIVLLVWQGMFAAVTPALAFGAIAERLRVFPFIIYVLVWSTLVYDVVVYWVWSTGGWLYKLGFIDFAGGIPVHVVAGCTGIGLCLALGKRLNANATPHNLPLMSIGTMLFWFGWLFFNAGSATAVNGRAVMAFINTNIAGSVGGLTWIFFDYRIHKKFTSLGFCSGAVAGLVCVTPGSGFIQPHYAILFGILGSLFANMTCFLKSKLEFDDTLDTFPVHAIAGMIGSILTGIFATNNVTRFSDYISVSPTEIGAIDGYGRQIGVQIAGVVAAGVYSFTVSFLLAKLFEFIPGLNLRVTQEEEMIGCDITLCGEVAYDFSNSGVRIGDYAQGGEFK